MTRRGQEEAVTPRIYNYTSGNKVPLTWGQIYRTADLHLRQNPLEGMVWYPGGSFKHYHSVNRSQSSVPGSTAGSDAVN